MRLVHKDRIFVRHWFRWYVFNGAEFQPVKFDRSLDGPSVFKSFKLFYEDLKSKPIKAKMK